MVQAADRALKWASPQVPGSRMTLRAAGAEFAASVTGGWSDQPCTNPAPFVEPASKQLTSGWPQSMAVADPLAWTRTPTLAYLGALNVSGSEEAGVDGSQEPVAGFQPAVLDAA